VDSAFLPVLMIVLLYVLIPARNRHNIFVPVVLGMLGLLNGVFHVWVLQGRADLALRSADAAVGLLVTLVTITAGRVTSMFTANAVPGYAFRRWWAIEALAVSLPLLAFAFDALGANAWLVGSAAGVTAVSHGARLARWRSWQVGRRPILFPFAEACLDRQQLARLSAGMVARRTITPQ
jgi:uncharacterized protein involved in response to NO